MLFMKIMSEIVVANSLYDFMTKFYLLDAFSHIIVLVIEKLALSAEIMLHHTQTT